MEVAHPKFEDYKSLLAYYRNENEDILVALETCQPYFEQKDIEHLLNDDNEVNDIDDEG